MPVSFFPLLLPSVFLIILAFGAVRGGRVLLRFVIVVGLLLSLILLPIYIQGWWLMIRARSGNPAVLYKLAKWREMHAERIGAWILWPEEPDVLGGFECLEQSAEKDYPPALYAVGVRLKYGQHVPKPP